MAVEVKFDQLKRSGPANTKGDDPALQHTDQVKRKISDESHSNFGSRRAVGGDE
jgi:hypothetical protein